MGQVTLENMERYVLGLQTDRGEEGGWGGSWKRGGARTKPSMRYVDLSEGLMGRWFIKGQR